MRAHEARVGDAAAIVAIYNAGIAERIATFETRPRAAVDIAGWFDGPHPIVVVEHAFARWGSTGGTLGSTAGGATSSSSSC